MGGGFPADGDCVPKCLAFRSRDMFAHTLFCNPDASVPHCHAPSICRLRSGTLLIAWYAYPEIETRQGTLVMTSKQARLSGWAEPRRILADLSGTLANPVLFEDAQGVLWLLFVTLRGHYWDSAVTLACSSVDEGESWSRPSAVSNELGMMVRHPPLLRSDGTLILPAYDERVNETVLLSKGIESPGWKEQYRFRGQRAIQGCLVRVTETAWSLALRPVGDDRVCLRAISSDEGRTWSPPIRTQLPNPLSGIAAFQDQDALCVVHNHTTLHDRHPLSLSHSFDRGVTWQFPAHIDTARHEVSYPSFLIDPDRVVHGAYTFDRTAIKYVSFDRSWWRK